MSSIEDLAARVAALEQRNHRVETEKAWETSTTRRVMLALLTFIALAAYFWAIGVERPMINAVVPTMGFMLSTLTMPLARRAWLARRGKPPAS
jgi:hypothetical protein